MNFSSLYKMQLSLDQSINAKHNTTYESTINKRILAFIVELGEFANETRCFKYWSLKGPSEKEVILEEYIDGIHFILSIGLALNFDINYEFNPIGSDDLTTQLLKTYELATKLNNSLSNSDYIDLFNNFLGLAKILNFEYSDLENAYFKKNQINYSRQENNY